MIDNLIKLIEAISKTPGIFWVTGILIFCLFITKWIRMASDGEE